MPDSAFATSDTRLGGDSRRKQAILVFFVCMSLAPLVYHVSQIRFDDQVHARPDQLGLIDGGSHLLTSPTTHAPPSTKAAVSTSGVNGRQASSSSSSSGGDVAQGFAEQALPADWRLDNFTRVMTSQGGQDRMLYNTLFYAAPHFNSGFFVEFGARDGVAHSNSHFFAKALGWRGLLAEAVPREQKGIAATRPEAAIIDGGICEKEGRREFSVTDKEGWNGMADEYDRARMDKAKAGRKISVACISLTTLLPLFGVRRVNYLSVDTEGSELQALRSFPWADIAADVVGVEVLTGSDNRKAKQHEITQFMAAQGYDVLQVFQFARDTADVFFVPAPDGAAARVRARAEGAPMYDAAVFEEARRTCKALQRCL